MTHIYVQILDSDVIKIIFNNMTYLIIIFSIHNTRFILYTLCFLLAHHGHRSKFCYYNYYIK